MLAVDIETYDPNLHELGDGAIRKDGTVLMVGMFDGNNFIFYTVDNPELRDRLSTNEPKVFHNALYDLNWLLHGYNIVVHGTIHDTMTRAVLLDEYADLDLDSCCKRHKIPGKNKANTIEAWYKTVYKDKGWKGSFWSNADKIWQDSEGRRQMVLYNKQDCIATYNLFHAQEPFMGPYKEAYDLEVRLLPVVMEMRKNGIKLDTVAKDQFTSFIQTERKRVQQALQYNYGITDKVLRSSKQMTTVMNGLGITSPVNTATGAQSWSADALDLISHDVVPLIQEIKNYNALLDKFLLSMDKFVVGERVHTNFAPNRREGRGAVTGRFSSYSPNLQNISAREIKHGQKAYGQEMRSFFLPEEGQMLAALDYSAIEAVLLAQYAVGPQAEDFRNNIRGGMDFHKWVQDLTGIKSRDVIKRMNYGFIYGMGLTKLISTNYILFRDLATAENKDIHTYGDIVYNQYHNRLPLIKQTMKHVQHVTQVQGYIKSIGGRIHHKPKPQWIDGKMVDFMYKMTNYLIQGAASEILKQGMVTAWESGIFDVLTLHLTVHDELVVSVPYNTQGTDALVALKGCMENVYKDKLSVPLKVEVEVGPHWGAWNKHIWQEMLHGCYTRNPLDKEDWYENKTT